MNFLDECKAKMENASKGPWTVVIEDDDLYIPEVLGMCEGCSGRLQPSRKEDAEFIAFSRSAMPELVRLLEEEMAHTKDLERLLEEWVADYDALKAKYEPSIAVISELEAPLSEDGK